MTYSGRAPESLFSSRVETVEAILAEKHSDKYIDRGQALGDVELIEKQLLLGGDTLSMLKRVVHLCSDETLRILSTNMEEKNYEQDPLYISLGKLLQTDDSQKWGFPINYYHLIHGVRHKIQNRTLKVGDYALLYDESKQQLSEEFLQRYKEIRLRYIDIETDIDLSSLFDNHTPNWQLSGGFGSKIVDAKEGVYSVSAPTLLSSSMGVGESLGFLENNIAICEEMFHSGVSSTDIESFLVEQGESVG